MTTPETSWPPRLKSTPRTRNKRGAAAAGSGQRVRNPFNRGRLTRECIAAFPAPPPGLLPRRESMSRIKNLREEALAMHKNYQGKIEVRVKVPVRETDDLTWLIRSALPSLHGNPQESGWTWDTYTNHSTSFRWCPTARPFWASATSIPPPPCRVMEGNPFAFKTFGDVDAFPLCASTPKTHRQNRRNVVELLSLPLGGVNL